MARRKTLDLNSAPLFGPAFDKPAPEPVQTPDDLPDYQALLEWVQTMALQGWRISFKWGSMAALTESGKLLLIACADELPGTHQTKLLRSFSSDEHNSLFVALNDLMNRMKGVLK